MTQAHQPVFHPPSGAARPRLAFLGTGYLGATYAICYAELGYDVLGFDVDEAKIAKLAAGQVPFHEPGLDGLLRRGLASRRLRFTTSYADVAEFADIHFICVGTPQQADSMAADMQYVAAAVTGIAPHLRRKALVVGKSTVPAGTAEWVERLVAEHAPGLDVEVAWSPEFLQEAHAVEDVLRPDRLVFGVKSEWAYAALFAAHKGVFDLAAGEDREVPVVVTDFATAELVKVAANSFLATKISFINAMSIMCDAVGADVSDLARAMGYDERIGSKFLRAGIGFGGGCLPKDIRAFQARAAELGVGDSLRLLHEVDRINNGQRDRVVHLAVELLDRPPARDGRLFDGTRIAVLGATFKPNTDDVRDSPALAVATALRDRGAHVVIFDPEGMENARRVLPDVSYAETLHDAVRDADVTCVLTAWDMFRLADPTELGTLVAERRVVDGMNCLDPKIWTAAGWAYRGLGRRTT
ncbi:MAG TPA: UDP-glucose/GDP-mannose dehydrogenase family protein [Cryptosporangiaceae bacterium]|nr:UDP-glucose/GDP-mannose dehydrogenase family protein [Cryptosporangiaceae bacterium]